VVAEIPYEVQKGRLIEQLRRAVQREEGAAVGGVRDESTEDVRIVLEPRAREARPDVPVIMITAYGDADTRRKAIEGGAAGLFTKPIDFPELRGEIGRRLEAVAGSA
jgi:DNA-binding NtrC family response regulator